MATETKMSHNTFISRRTFGRSLLDSLYASRQVNTIGRRSADYRESWSADWKTFWLIKLIGEVCF